MNAVFDTLKAVKALKEAGFDEAQAEALIHTVGEAVTETVATQANLSASEARLQTEIAGTQSEQRAAEARLKTEIATVRTEIATLKADFYKQFWIMGAGIVAVTVTLIKVL